MLAFQDRIASAVLGPAAASGTPITGLTAGLLLAYGTFFLLGFALYAFVYAAVGSFVSRPDDLQTLSLPLSLLAMAGYLGALPILLTGGAGPIARLMSLLPPFSPFAMLARLMVGQVPPWEVALSLACSSSRSRPWPWRRSGSIPRACCCTGSARAFASSWPRRDAPAEPRGRASVSPRQVQRQALDEREHRRGGGPRRFVLDRLLGLGRRRRVLPR